MISSCSTGLCLVDCKSFFKHFKLKSFKIIIKAGFNLFNYYKILKSIFFSHNPHSIIYFFSIIIFTIIDLFCIIIFTIINFFSISFIIHIIFSFIIFAMKYYCVQFLEERLTFGCFTF